MTTPPILRRLSTGELASYLSTQGLSQSGIQSIKDVVKKGKEKTSRASVSTETSGLLGTKRKPENGISGEMLMDFCEEDIKDAFSVFKDRFIIRKVIREINSPRVKYDPYHLPRKTENQAHIEQRKISSPMPFQDRSAGSRVRMNTSAGGLSNMRFCAPAIQTNTTAYQKSNATNSQSIAAGQSLSQTIPFGYSDQTIVSGQSNQRSSTMSSQAVTQPQHSHPPPMMRLTSPYPVSIQKVQVCAPPLLCSDIKSESRIRSPTVSSTQEERQRRQVEHQSQRSSQSSDVQVIDISEDFDHDSSTFERANSIYQGAIDLVTLDERNRLKKYTANQLLEKKSLRGRPNEAQHLGALAIRNAAQAAKIWETAPLMRNIPESCMTKFKECIIAFAPQLGDQMELVICRLREALQNRRKYLLDRDTGKRAQAMKRSRQNSISSQGNVKSEPESTLIITHSHKGEVKDEKTDFVIEIQ